MTKNIFAITLLLACSVIFFSCDKDDNDLLTKNKYANELEQLFPNASRVEWTAVGTYGVAEFDYNGTETKVWFTDNSVSKWQMTETDILYTSLPQTIKTAFEAGKYSSWKVDDVDKLDRVGVETIYVIEIEKGEAEMSLHYSTDGILVQITEDFDDDNQTALPPVENIDTAIEKYIKLNYPGAKIIDKDIENKLIEVDIIHENKHKELKFNSKNEWLSTCIDLSVSETPQLILTAISSNPSYSAYHIDDVEFWQTSQGNYYQIDLEGAGADIKVKVSEAGVIL